MDITRYEVEKMEIKLAYLELIDMNLEKLLDLLKIDLSKVIPGKGKLCCPKCTLPPKEGALVVIHKDYTTDSPLLRKVRARDDKNLSAMTTDYYICECGCVYKFFTGHKKEIKKNG